MNFWTIVPSWLASVISLHHPRRPGHVDLPHAVDVEHSRAHLIQHKGQMHNRRRPAIPQQKKKLAAGFLVAQVHALESHRQIGHRRRNVHPDHVKLGQLRQQTGSQISGNSRDHHSWF